MYRWWVFVHVLGVFGFLLTHGVSMSVIFRIRRETDPRRVVALLELSSASIQAFYVSFLVLLVGGIAAGVQGHWFSQAWLWTAIGILVLTTGAMYGLARPYTRRVGLVARAMAGGSEAVSPQQFQGILRSSRPWTIAGVGFAGLAIILFLMVVKPSFSFGGGAGPITGATCAPSGTSLRVTAKNVAFDTGCLAAPAGQAFTIAFANQDPGVPHNVAIYRDASATQVLYRGEVVTGSATVTYRVGPLPAGTYLFRCDVHPFMKGAFVVGTPAGATPAG